MGQQFAPISSQNGVGLNSQKLPLIGHASGHASQPLASFDKKNMAVSFETKRESLLDEGAQLDTSETKRKTLEANDKDINIELVEFEKVSTTSETKREKLGTEGEALLEPLISLDEVRAQTRMQKLQGVNVAVFRPQLDF